jgi:hypothetical protein
MEIGPSESLGRPPHPISCLWHEMSLSPEGRGETACGGLAKCVSHPSGEPDMAFFLTPDP